MPSINEVADRFFFKYSDNPYKVDDVTVQFETDGENQLTAYVTTPQTEMTSTTRDALDLYDSMCSQQEIMELYGLGQPWERNYTANRLNLWSSTWENHVPFSGFMVREKENETFIGHIALDYDESTPQQSAEISYIFNNTYKGSGLASEAIWSVVNPYSTAIIAHDYLCQGLPYTGIYSTVRPDNPSSITVLLKAGLDIQQTDGKPFQTKWGDRLSFFKPIDNNLESFPERFPNLSELRNSDYNWS